MPLSKILRGGSWFQSHVLQRLTRRFLSNFWSKLVCLNLILIFPNFYPLIYMLSGCSEPSEMRGSIPTEMRAETRKLGSYSVEALYHDPSWASLIFWLTTILRARCRGSSRQCPSIVFSSKAFGFSSSLGLTFLYLGNQLLGNFTRDSRWVKRSSASW